MDVKKYLQDAKDYIGDIDLSQSISDFISNQKEKKLRNLDVKERAVKLGIDIKNDEDAPKTIQSQKQVVKERGGMEATPSPVKIKESSPVGKKEPIKPVGNSFVKDPSKLFSLKDSAKKNLSASSQNSESLTDIMLVQLEKHEGFREERYYDTKGIPTIGHGFNLMRSDARRKLEEIGLDYHEVRAGRQTITREQSMYLAKQDIQSSIQDARVLFKNFDNLDSVRQRVLVDMAYNLGRDRLSKFYAFRKAVEEENFAKAARRMERSAWYHQVKSRGVYLASLMSSGMDITL